MRSRLLPLVTASSLVLAAASSAAPLHTTSDLDVRMTPGRAGNTATAVVRGPANAPFALFAETDWAPGRTWRVATGATDATGRGTHVFEVPSAFLHAGLSVRMRALVIDETGARVATDDTTLDCSIISFEGFSADYSMHAMDVMPGEVLAEQWADIGLHVRAENALPGPDIAIAFDSSNPSGDDFDLMTPGPGTNNSFGFGNVMIVAENDVDMNGDTYIDDPDDDRYGGTLFYTWDDPVLLRTVTLVDVDTLDPAGATVRSYLGGTLVQSFFVPGLDDNNVQVVAFDDLARVDELQVEFSGSGAVAEVQFLPCPLRLTFDTSTTGIPFPHGAGTIVTDQFFSQGVDVSGVTNNASHPDAVVMFDTANPTGGDDDLMTPGTGIDNTEARGMVLVLADNVVDMDGDGLVDDPGDSSDGGTFTFDFSVCVTLESATVLDIDTAEPDCTFQAFDENGVLLMEWDLAQLGDNSIQTVDFGSLPMVRKLELTLCSSGALVDLVYCPTPEVGGGN